MRQCTFKTKIPITILACAKAAGQAIPTMIVFGCKNFNSLLSKVKVPATLYRMSQNG